MVSPLAAVGSFCAGALPIAGSLSPTGSLPLLSSMRAQAMVHPAGHLTAIKTPSYACHISFDPRTILALRATAEAAAPVGRDAHRPCQFASASSTSRGLARETAGAVVLGGSRLTRYFPNCLARIFCVNYKTTEIRLRA
jgi:hypothetical protein